MGKRKTADPKSNQVVIIEQNALQRLDESMLEEMGAEDCTLQEVAAVMGTSVEVIENLYGDVVLRGRNRGNAALRKRMFEKAIGGDVRLLEWLSKNRLGYRDKFPEEDPNVVFKININEVPK